MNKLIELLKSLRPDIDFESEKHLIDDGILTSFDIIEISSEIQDEFDIDLTPLDMVPENFQSADAMHEMIKRLSDEDE